MATVPTGTSNDVTKPFLYLHTVLSFGEGFCFHLISPCLCFSFSPGTVGFRTEGDAGKQTQDRSAKVDRGRRQGDEYADHFQKFGDKVSVPRDATGTSLSPKDSLGKARKDTPSSRQIHLVDGR